MVACNQRKCRWVAQDLSQGGRLVCSAPDNEMLRVGTGRSFILYCSAYGRRPEWNGNFPDRGIPSLTGTVDIDPEGLYPGQKRPPKDYTDVDPEEGEEGAAPDDTCDT